MRHGNIGRARASSCDMIMPSSFIRQLPSKVPRWVWVDGVNYQRKSHDSSRVAQVAWLNPHVSTPMSQPPWAIRLETLISCAFINGRSDLRHTQPLTSHT
jgi:hypothetical protein